MALKDIQCYFGDYNNQMGPLFSNFGTDHLQQFFNTMNRPKPTLNHNKPIQKNRPVVVAPPKKTVLPQSRPLVGTTRRISKIGHHKPTPLATPSAPTVKQLLEKINFQEDEHQEIWHKFEEASKSCFKFNMFNLTPLNDQGKQLLKDGYFLTCWIKAICKNPYINSSLILQQAYKEHFGGIEANKEIFQNFYKEKIQAAVAAQQNNATPVRPTKNAEGSKLKRSILKNSERKVQFGEDRILYPSLEEPKQNIFKTKLLPTIEQRKKSSYETNKFVIDYFEINDIYLLEEVEIIGLVKEYKEKYGIFLVKDKQREKQFTCIAVQNNESQQSKNKNSNFGHQLNILKEFEKDYFITGFLQLEGRGLGEAWVDTLPTESRKK